MRKERKSAKKAVSPMSDPYKVLGVSREASDDEIKSAYRALAKKYHPDVNPGNEQAAQRMNEINAAYDAIKSGDISSGNAWGAYGGTPWQGAYSYRGTSSSEYERTELRAAENYIRVGHYREAMNALSGVSVGDRNARWFFLAALANVGVGNKISALEYAKRAVEMEPGNMEYRQLLNSIEHGGNVYTGYSRGFSGGALRVDRLCLGLCAAQMCCRYPFCFCC